MSTLLKPYPFQTVTDSFGYISNSNYHGLQVVASMRAWHGLTVNANYTYSRAIDDSGTFRSGYAIPAGTVANHPTASYPVDRIERTVSTSNQKHHFVVTSVWDWPLGKTILNSNTIERAILGGFKFSGIAQDYSGSPLAITASACQTNPSNPQSTSSCAPTINTNFVGPARMNGRWGKGATVNNYTSMQLHRSQHWRSHEWPCFKCLRTVHRPGRQIYLGYVVGRGVGQQATLLGTAAAPNYTFGNAPRTAPYGLTGPGNYQLDLAMVRSFPLHLTAASKLNFRAEWYNVTNHTLFAVASTVVGNASFGQVTASSDRQPQGLRSSRHVSSSSVYPCISQKRLPETAASFVFGYTAPALLCDLLHCTDLCQCVVSTSASWLQLIQRRFTTRS